MDVTSFSQLMEDCGGGPHTVTGEKQYRGYCLNVETLPTELFKEAVVLVRSIITIVAFEMQ